MKAIVWGNTFERASKKLDEIEKEYERYRTAKLIKKTKTKSYHMLKFDNNDYWIAQSARESAKGSRCNISYIDTMIPLEFIDTVIKYCTSAGPYQAIKYFYVGE